ncbi:hypothetical protein PENTCL1PPCAC_28089, partial [Pristionchus entomophagus]
HISRFAGGLTQHLRRGIMRLQDRRWNHQGITQGHLRTDRNEGSVRRCGKYGIVLPTSMWSRRLSENSLYPFFCNF